MSHDPDSLDLIIGISLGNLVIVCSVIFFVCWCDGCCCFSNCSRQTNRSNTPVKSSLSISTTKSSLSISPAKPMEDFSVSIDDVQTQSFEKLKASI